jgi:hypothetical protein
MPTHEERLKILRLLEEGKITADQAVKLMEAVGPSPKEPAEPGHAPYTRRNPRWFRIHVSEVRSGKVLVDVRLPLTLVSAGVKLGAHFSPDVTGLDMDEIMKLIHSGAIGRVFEAEQAQNERVEIYIE